jgi:hypothetical protein
MFVKGFDLHITLDESIVNNDDDMPALVSGDDFLNSKGVLRHRVTSCGGIGSSQSLRDGPNAASLRQPSQKVRFTPSYCS